MTGEDWLQQFFRVVDRSRLERGRKLYSEEKLLSLRKTEEGFLAHVRGSRSKTYEVHAHFTTDEDGLPDIEELAIECSCPDWVEFCKHSICTMIHYCHHELDVKMEKPGRFSKYAEDVKKAMTRDMQQIADLGPPPFLSNDQTLLRMHGIVQKKLRDRVF